jgi:hypothetical protein
MTNKTRYIYFDEAYEIHYVYGSTPVQAARALAKRLNKYIDHNKVKLEPQPKKVRQLHVYTFARKTSPYDKTSYEEILAVSDKQAWFFFKRSRGTQYFAIIDSVRVATKEDKARLEFGVIYDVTW